MSKTVVVINGKGGIGKDTLIDALDKQTDISVYNVSSIDPFREIADKFNNSGEKNDSYRLLLSELKQNIDDYYKKENGITFSDEYLKNHLRMFAEFSDNDKGGTDNVMFVHIREPENIKSFLETAKTQLMLMGDKDTYLTSLLVRSDRAKEDYGNRSDNCVEDYAYDFIFDSNGSKEEDCKQFVKAFCREVLGEQNHERTTQRKKQAAELLKG